MFTIEYLTNVENILFYLPIKFEKIVNILKSKDWIIHNFNLDHDNIYIPDGFLYNTNIENIQYTLYLDTNIYQFLLNSYKKIPNENNRCAISLLVFCQVCSIQIEPMYAVYEKIDYRKERALDVIHDLNLFHKINNSPTDSLIDYALSERDTYDLGFHDDIDSPTLEKELTKYSRLTEWDSIYLLILVCVSISLESTSRKEKLHKFVHWMVKYFRKSFVIFIYATIYFSERRLKKMMKYKNTDSCEKQKKQLFNMTWDLYIANQFFHLWVSENKNSEFMYASDDKSFSFIMRMAIKSQINENIDPLKNMLSKKDYQIVIDAWDHDIPDEERIYQSEIWTPDYRSSQIKIFEDKLLKT